MSHWSLLLWMNFLIFDILFLSFQKQEIDNIIKCQESAPKLAPSSVPFLTLILSVWANKRWCSTNLPAPGDPSLKSTHPRLQQTPAQGRGPKIQKIFGSKRKYLVIGLSHGKNVIFTLQKQDQDIQRQDIYWVYIIDILDFTEMLLDWASSVQVA